MKLKIKPWRLIWRFLILLVILLAIIFCTTITVFYDFQNGRFAEWGASQTIVVVIMVGITIVSFIPSLTSSYYLCEDKYFIQVKYGRQFAFEYDNIEYIDFENSKKKDMVIFYSKNVKMRYMLADKDGVLLKTLKKKCHNLMERDEFYRIHPEER